MASRSNQLTAAASVYGHAPGRTLIPGKADVNVDAAAQLEEH